MLFKYKSFIFSILFLIYAFQEVSCAADSSDISRLRAKILENYDKQSRPTQRQNESIVVKVNFNNNGFEIDEQRNMITFHLFAFMYWEDQHVKWDPLNYGNLSEITFSPSEIWTPDISVINNFDESEIDHFGNTLILAAYDSGLWWIPPCKFQVHCLFDFRLWPYDKQSCKIILSSWSYDGTEVDFQIRANITELIVDTSWQEHLLENRQWMLLRSSVQRTSKLVYCCPEVPLVEIVITVDLQRRSTSHTVAITVVGLVITAAMLVSFWLDPFAQERLPLTLLILLMNSIYLQYMHQVIPNNGSSVPLAICFFRDSLIMATFAFAWSVGIRYMAKTKRNSPVPLPNFIQTFLSSFAATVLCLNPRPQSKGQVQKNLKANSDGDDGDVSDLVEEESAADIQENWEWLARFLDRITFVAYLLTYSVFILAFL